MGTATSRGHEASARDPSSWNVPSRLEALPDFLIRRRCCLVGAGHPGVTRLCYQVLIHMKELIAEKALPTAVLQSPYTPPPCSWTARGSAGGVGALYRGKAWVVSKALVPFCPEHRESTINTGLAAPAPAPAPGLAPALAAAQLQPLPVVQLQPQPSSTQNTPQPQPRPSLGPGEPTLA